MFHNITLSDIHTIFSDYCPVSVCCSVLRPPRCFQFFSLPNFWATLAKWVSQSQQSVTRTVGICPPNSINTVSGSCEEVILLFTGKSRGKEKKIFSWSNIGRMDGRARITETIFNLKNLTLRSGQDSTEILENEESEPGSTQRISKDKKLRWSSALKISFFLVLLCSLVGLVCVEVQTRNLMQSYQERIAQLENSVRGNNETSYRKYKDLRKLREEFTDVKKGTLDFENKLESDLRDAEKISSSQLKTFLEESNMTLCTIDKNVIHFPVDGNYKLFVNLVVTGHIYAEEQIVKLKLNNVSLAGGVVKVTAEEAAEEKDGGKCGEFEQGQKCFKVKHAMLLRVKAGDMVTAEQDKRNTGVIVREKICIRYSELTLPDNVTSTVITH